MSGETGCTPVLASSAKRLRKTRLGHTLSGGEKQRLAFARLLLNKPNIIVLDETTSALDEKTQDKITAMLIEELLDATVLSVAHRIELEAFHAPKMTWKGAKAVPNLSVTSALYDVIEKWPTLPPHKGPTFIQEISGAAMKANDTGFRFPLPFSISLQSNRNISSLASIQGTGSFHRFLFWYAIKMKPDVSMRSAA